MGIQKSELLAKAFGGAWIIDHLVPKLVKVFEEDQIGYNYRMTAIKTWSIVVKYMSKDDITNTIVPLYAKAIVDKIPNVSFCAC